MNFLTTPLSYTRDQRTSRDVCRDACAITAFERRAGQTAVYIACAIGFVVVAASIYFN